MTEWISVKDKLPDKYLEEVLICLENKEIALGCYNTISYQWYYNCSCNLHENDCECRTRNSERWSQLLTSVIYWMPLPNPPTSSS